eukprot:SAG11_NODE_1109_length_5830_cov_4.525388_1_plen_246_part_00
MPKKKKKKKGAKDSAAVNHTAIVDSRESQWERDENGKLIPDASRGHSMITSLGNLFNHLRAQDHKHLVDTYGLWLLGPSSSSDEYEREVDGVYSDLSIILPLCLTMRLSNAQMGTVLYDSRFTEELQSTKKIKNAIKKGNPELMPVEELQSELLALDLSTKGDKERLQIRLTEAMEAKAQSMRETTPLVNHFTSHKTVRLFLVSKRIEAVQNDETYNAYVCTANEHPGTCGEAQQRSARRPAGQT